jgi:hypothetical protein
MRGQKITEALQAAVNGNLARVTVEGQTWVRVEEVEQQKQRALVAEHHLADAVAAHSKFLIDYDRMREILRPFADAADAAERNLCKHNTDEILIRLGLLRAARALLYEQKYGSL